MRTQWKYACVNRPPVFGAVPGGAIRHEPPVPTVSMARHGFVVYDRELTEEECQMYEIFPHRSLEEIVDHYLPLFEKWDAEYVHENGNEHIKEAMWGRHGSFAGGYTHLTRDEVVGHVTRALLARYGYAV